MDRYLCLVRMMEVGECPGRVALFYIHPAEAIGAPSQLVLGILQYFVEVKAMWFICRKPVICHYRHFLFVSTLRSIFIITTIENLRVT